MHRTVNKMVGGLCLALILSLVSSQSVWGQFSGRGPREGSSFGGPADFLRRIDTNGNGMIDPSETQSGSGAFLQRMASRIPNIDLSKPVSIERLAKEFERMRSERSRGPSDSSSSDRGRGSSSSNSRSFSGSRSPKVEPLVPGFGLEEELDPILGFGDLAVTVKIELTDKDREYAERSFRYYDKNHDGVVDKEEMSKSRSRYLSESDRNQDGKVTLKELTTRYAQIRIEREQRSSSSSSSNTSSPSSRSITITRSSSSSNTDQRVNMILQSVFDRYDRNKNGVFERDEWKNFRSDPSSADTNRDGKITKDEIKKWLKDRYGSSSASTNRGGFSRGGGDRGGFGGGQRFSSSSAPSFGPSTSSSFRPSGSSNGASLDRKSYRFLTPTERLPEGLPSWFRENDQDQDGQIVMAEFSSQWSDGIAAEFFQFDTNNDGIVTASECLQAKDNGTVRSLATGFDNSSAARLGSAQSPSTAGSSASSSPSATTGLATGGNTEGIDPRTLAYFRKYFAQYDTNGDGELVQEEWGKMSKNPKEADADGNQRITVVEFARWKVK